jgi:clorobiocin biosynthesis protein CloN4
VHDLTELVEASASRWPDRPAVVGPNRTLTYADLTTEADAFAIALHDAGVRRGDRVGIWLEKSATAIAAMQGALRLGAAYVPLDPLAPRHRVEHIVRDCEMRALVTTEDRASLVQADDLPEVASVVVDVATGSSAGDREISGEPPPRVRVDPDDLAYILYTSGSTGTPKGVCISHRNALSFVEGAADELGADESDRLSNHAPFHFDLSVLDLYVAFMAGASVHLIPDGLSYVPDRLVGFLVEHEITVWYSVPSALILMMEQGGLLDVPSMPTRAFLFAGEPFPTIHLRRLVERWPGARFLNLYGPTETNVCTYHEVTHLDPDRVAPVPIGTACSGDRVWAVTADGSVAGPGDEGELMVEGPTVMLGYWGRPPHGSDPYATGDIVRMDRDGRYTFVGRRDHMVKVRGYRIELGEIEAALTSHPEIREAAVTVGGSGLDRRLVAHAVPNGAAPNLLEVKRHCAALLPRYMIVDELRLVPALPRTRNGKIDRLALDGDHDPITDDLL